MAEFSGKDSSLLYMKQIQQQGTRTDAPSWVYYKKLEETNPSFYEIVNNRIKTSFGEQGYNNQRLQAAEKLSNMASVERAKELQFLQKTFGANINVDLSDLNSVKNFVKAFQELMRFKGVADRAKQRLLAGEKHISIAPFLNDYFINAIKEDVETSLSQYVNALNSQTTSFETFFQSRLTIIMNQAADKLAKSNNIRGKDDSGKGYMELFTELQSHPNMLNQFFQQINKDNNFANLIKQVSDSLSTDNTGKNLMQILENKKPGKISRFTSGGTVQEILETYAINLLMGKKIPNVSFKATQVGGKGARPDVLMEVDLGIQTGLIENEFNKMVDASREEARKAAKNIMDILSKTDEGFLVYTNMKNYGLDSKTHFKGTENMKLQQYYNLMSEIQNTNKLSQFVTAIMNTLDGAIAEDLDEQISSLIAQDLAYFLFDDYEAIGTSLPKGGQTIHLFMLSDFYVPLSMLLQLLSDSFKDLSDNPKKYGDITIYSGSIKYPNGPWGMEQWIDQRKTALDEIELGIRFFRNFTSWIEEQLR